MTWFLPSGAALLLGWALGSNHAASIFGPAVATRLLRFRTSAILASIFIIIGAVAHGHRGMETLGQLATQSHRSAAVALLAAGLTLAGMTALGLPVSSSQAVVGAILGGAALSGNVDFSPLKRIVLCWVATPFTAMVISAVSYIALGRLLEFKRLGLVKIDTLMRLGLIASGCYGAYALGANNVANSTGILVKAGVLSPFNAALLGGLAIALGVCTFSRGVMFTVGAGLVSLDSVSAFVAVAAHSVTLHFFAIVGVPVSSSEAIVGAVLGIGLVKGVRTIRRRTIASVLAGWLATPAVAFLLAVAFNALASR